MWHEVASVAIKKKDLRPSTWKVTIIYGVTWSDQVILIPVEACQQEFLQLPFAQAYGEIKVLQEALRETDEAGCKRSPYYLFAQE